jgi:hypothetical protein
MVFGMIKSVEVELVETHSTLIAVDLGIMDHTS